APARASRSLAAQIASAFAARLALDVRVIVKSAAELATVVRENALARPACEPARLLVAFVQGKKELQSLSAIAGLTAGRERFVLGSAAGYLYCAGGIIGSRAGAALLGRMGQSATTRNWATVLRLHALAAAGR